MEKMTENLIDIGIDIIKIASADLTDKSLIESACRTHLPLTQQACQHCMKYKEHVRRLTNMESMIFLYCTVRHAIQQKIIFKC